MILITVLLHPITHVGKIATQIAAGVPPAGLGLANPPLSAGWPICFANYQYHSLAYFLVLEPLGFCAGGAGDYRLYPLLPHVCGGH